MERGRETVVHICMQEGQLKIGRSVVFVVPGNHRLAANVARGLINEGTKL
jgi:hypothetical protein